MLTLTRSNNQLLFLVLILLSLSACSAINNGIEISNEGDGSSSLNVIAEDASSLKSDTERAEVKRPKATISIMAVGDMMLGTDYPDYRLAPNDGRDLLAGVSEILSQADITFGNLEGTFGTAGTAEKECPDVRRCYVFRMPPHYAEYLKLAGFDVMSMANNHARDFGDSGRLLTMKTLDDVGIQHSGLMDDIASWKIKDLKVALIAFAPFRGAHDFLDLDYVATTIKDLSKLFDIVIVSFHGGAEGDAHTHVPFEEEFFHGENRGDVALFSHTAIDAGADVILGHGPHVPRALELYKGKIIAYSLGNFCTTLGINVAGKNGLAPILSLKINQNGDFTSGKIISARQKRPNGPLLDSNHNAAKLMKQLTEQDFPQSPLEIDVLGNIAVKTVQ